MGALHRGHQSLIEAARASCDTVAASIFVNPIQFGDVSDLERYPRTLDEDLALLAETGCDLAFVPSVVEIYPGAPAPPATSLSVGGVALGYEGSDRPGHFDGMATVVALLLNLTRSTHAFFGEKDFQQLCVVRQMVRDLAIDVAIVGCPTVREPDGLAMSSRNVQLSATGRRQALALSGALSAGCAAAGASARVDDLSGAMAAVIEAQEGIELSYAAVVDPDTMARPVDASPGDEVRLLVAAIVEGVRLLDNAGATLGPER
jgi:pantoate--beta-alanine ligase